MNEQHFDALPPVNPSQQPESQASNPGGEVTMTGQGELPGSSAGMPSPVAQANPLTAAQASNMSVDEIVDAAVASSPPPIAEDVDLIEKEWVEKAKQIVEQTKHDPYEQNAAMTKMKTDYLKKRYNRDIKMDDV